jgi:hypothetical protein
MANNTNRKKNIYRISNLIGNGEFKKTHINNQQITGTRERRKNLCESLRKEKY